MQIQIRQASLSDVSRLAAANQAMAFETEHQKLDLKVLTQGVELLLKDENKGRYWVAEKFDASKNEFLVVGQLMLTREWSDWRAQWFWWIQSVYVWPDYRRQGFYRALYAEVKKQALAAKNVCGIRLYVEKENKRAQQTYEMMGMKENEYRFYETMICLENDK